MTNQATHLNDRYHYIGCFFTWKTWRSVLDHYPSVHLPVMIKRPHITFRYKPDTIDDSLFGAPIRVRIIGYGKSEDNEGFLVEASASEESLTEMIRQIPVPHITISISESGEAVNTRYLDFLPLEDSMEIYGYYGGVR